MKIVSTGKTLSLTEYHERRVRARRKRWMIYGGIILVVLVALTLVSRLQSLRIKNITVIGAEAISTDLVRAVTLDALSGYYLWLVPRDNSLIYSRDTVIEMLNRKFPRFSSINLNLSNPTSLDISVIEREPFALYCGHLSGTSESSPCYFLDDQGFIFDTAPVFSEGVYFIYSSDPDFENPLGQEYLPREEFNLLGEFVRSLTTLGFKPLSVVMGEKEFQLSTVTETKILWPRTDNFSAVFSNLESFLNDPAIKAQKDFIEKISELDLRTINKVFWKLK